eukprot:353226-Chlamydomonas_euryale.AAC.8
MRRCTNSQAARWALRDAVLMHDGKMHQPVDGVRSLFGVHEGCVQGLTMHSPTPDQPGVSHSTERPPVFCVCSRAAHSTGSHPPCHAWNLPFTWRTISVEQQNLAAVARSDRAPRIGWAQVTTNCRHSGNAV